MFVLSFLTLIQVTLLYSYLSNSRVKNILKKVFQIFKEKIDASFRIIRMNEI